MTVKRIVGSDKFIGATGEAPTDGATTVRPGATFYDKDTGILYITYDGTNWIAKTILTGLVSPDGSVITDDTAGAIKSMPVDEAGDYSAGYEFTINGVNFNGYAKIKTLMLPSDCASGAFLTFHHYNDEGTEEDYEVPTDKVFIALQALVYESNAAGIGVVGETTAADTTPFTKEVLFLSNGTALPSMENCWGVFAAGEFVTASSISYTFKSGSALYGVEVDA